MLRNLKSIASGHCICGANRKQILNRYDGIQNSCEHLNQRLISSIFKKMSDQYYI